MRSIYLLVTLLILNSVIFGQDRINKTLPKVNSSIKGQLLKATGWTLNPEEQWISRQNRIPIFLENEYKTLIDYEKDGLGIDNFLSYQLRDIKIGDKTFSMLIKKYKDGEFKYPSIKEGWLNYTRLVYYVFEMTELEKVKNIKNDSINFITLKILYTNAGDFGVSFSADNYLTDLSKDIVTKMKEEVKPEKERYLALHIKPIKQKNIIQFQIYYFEEKPKSIYSSGSYIYGIISEFTIKESSTSLSEGEQVYGTSKLFKHCYFETDYSSFNSFLKID